MTTTEIQELAAKAVATGCVPVLKVCSCKAAYSAEEWEALPLVGPCEFDDESLEARICRSCSSSLSVRVGCIFDGLKRAEVVKAAVLAEALAHEVVEVERVAAHPSERFMAARELEDEGKLRWERVVGRSGPGVGGGVRVLYRLTPAGMTAAR
jgi:hypothetical protein